MKIVVWEGNSREALRNFLEGVRKDLGTGLMFLQCGAVPLDAKPFKTGMPGTWELRAKDASGQYRALYVCLIKDRIHVLHCFKKTTSATAQLRYRALQRRIRDEEIKGFD